MKRKVLLNLVLLTMWCWLSVSSAFAQATFNITLTASDKAQIVKSIFQREFSICRKKQPPTDKYLSPENIQDIHLPKLSCANLIALTQMELAEKKKGGLTFYRFDKFDVQGNQVLVSLSSTRANKHYASQQGTQYKYRKQGKIWAGKVIGGYGGVSESGSDLH